MSALFAHGSGFANGGLFTLLLLFSLKVDNAFAASEQTAQQENSAKEKADDSSPALTIYNQNFFVARDMYRST